MLLIVKTEKLMCCEIMARYFRKGLNMFFKWLLKHLKRKRFLKYCPYCKNLEPNIKCGKYSQVVCESCGMEGPFGTETTCVSNWNELPRD